MVNQGLLENVVIKVMRDLVGNRVSKAILGQAVPRVLLESMEEQGKMVLKVVKEQRVQWDQQVPRDVPEPLVPREMQV